MKCVMSRDTYRSMKLFCILMLSHFAFGAHCIKLTPDKQINNTAVTNIQMNNTANYRTIGLGTWAAFFRIVVSTTENGNTQNQDAEIQLVYHEYNDEFEYSVLSKSKRMSYIYTCSVSHDPAKGYGYTVLSFDTNYNDNGGTSCTLTYQIDVNGDVQFRNPVFEYGKRQPSFLHQG